MTKSSLRLSKRRGLTQFTHKSEHFRDLRCMLFRGGGGGGGGGGSSNGGGGGLDHHRTGHVFLAGAQETLVDCDLETLKHTRVVATYEPETGRGLKCVHFIKGNPKFLCMADGEGKV